MGSVGKCQNYRLFDIFWDILDKMKDNLDEECVKRAFYPSREKIGTTDPDFPGKMTGFPVLTLLFHLCLPKIWHSHLHKNYIFEMRNNRAIR